MQDGLGIQGQLCIPDVLLKLNLYHAYFILIANINLTLNANQAYSFLTESVVFGCFSVDQKSNM